MGLFILGSVNLPGLFASHSLPFSNVPKTSSYDGHIVIYHHCYALGDAYDKLSRKRFRIILLSHNCKRVVALEYQIQKFVINFLLFFQGKSTEVKCECLDILCDVLHRFGNLMTTDHEQLLNALLSQLGTNQTSVRKKSIACTGE